MKKITSLMLGLSLVVGTATFALAQDKDTSKKDTTKKKAPKKSTDKKDKKKSTS
jgi:hypothetical protein